MYFISSIERRLLDEAWPGNYQPSPLSRYLGPLLGVKQTSKKVSVTSAFDPKRTFVAGDQMQNGVTLQLVQ